MILVEKVIGNIKTEQTWLDKLSEYQHDTLSLEQWEAQKSRCRKKSKLGLDIGIALDRQANLTDGDVLFCDEEKQYLLTVKIFLRDVMVINLDRLITLDFETIAKHIFELGHALGNQHWKSLVKAKKVYVPLTVDVKMMDSMMRTHGYNQTEYNFVQGETILPVLSPSESKLLFGGAEEAHTHIDVSSCHQNQ